MQDENIIQQAADTSQR